MSQQLSTQLRQKCVELCSQYIWPKVSEEELSFEEIIGGLTNQIIRCTHLDSTQTITETAIKLYRKDRPLHANDSVFNHIIIGLIVSEKGLAPKIYGISRDAVLMEYIDVSSIHIIDLDHSSLVNFQ